MNRIRKMLKVLRQESYAGQHLREYELPRYTWGDVYAQGIIVPPNPVTLADVSFYQARMDWNRYPHPAAIIRLGQNVWKDSEFEFNYSETKRLKITTGGYWFFDDRVSPEQQFNVIKSMMAGKQLEMEIFVDVERTYGGAYGGAKNIRRLMELIETLGIKTGIYTGFYYWRDKILPGCTTDDKAYFSKRPLWLAWYAGASVVQIPQPWTDWLIWQYGTPTVDWGQPTAEIDANKFNGDKAKFDARYNVSSPEEITNPYDGVTTIKGKRSGWDYTIDVIDTSKVRFEFVHGNPLARPSDVAISKGASLAYNGGEWDKVSMPQDLSIQNNNVYVQRQADRPSFYIMDDGSASISHVNKAGVKHALTGLRYLVRYGDIQQYLYGTEPQYTEGHARTCYGIDSAGFVMVFVCNGLYPNQGLRLSEVAEIMWMHGAIDVFDAGGGGDTVRVKDGIVTNVPQDGAVRYVPETVLIYAQEADMARYTAISANAMSVRKDHSVYAAKVYTQPAGVPMHGDVLWVAPADGDLVKAGDQWLQLTDSNWVAIVHLGVRYCELTDTQPVVDDEIEIFVNGELKYHIIGKLQ